MGLNRFVSGDYGRYADVKSYFSCPEKIGKNNAWLADSGAHIYDGTLVRKVISRSLKKNKMADVLIVVSKLF